MTQKRLEANETAVDRVVGDDIDGRRRLRCDRGLELENTAVSGGTDLDHPGARDTDHLRDTCAEIDVVSFLKNDLVFHSRRVGKLLNSGHVAARHAGGHRNRNARRRTPGNAPGFGARCLGDCLRGGPLKLGHFNAVRQDFGDGGNDLVTDRAGTMNRLGARKVYNVAKAKLRKQIGHRQFLRRGPSQGLSRKAALLTPNLRYASHLV